MSRPLLCIIGAIIQCTVLAVDLPVDSPQAIQAAEWAVKKLQNTSETGIYRTISLQHILSASTQQGRYHENIEVQVQLTSPHFASADRSSRHNFIIMTDLQDPRIKTLAIDDFPAVDDAALEHFWRQAVETRKHKRIELLAALRDTQPEAIPPPTTLEPVVQPDVFTHTEPQPDATASTGESLPVRNGVPAGNAALSLGDSATTPVVPLTPLTPKRSQDHTTAVDAKISENDKDESRIAVEATGEFRSG